MQVLKVFTGSLALCVCTSYAMLTSETEPRYYELKSDNESQISIPDLQQQIASLQEEARCRAQAQCARETKQLVQDQQRKELEQENAALYGYVQLALKVRATKKNEKHVPELEVIESVLNGYPYQNGVCKQHLQTLLQASKKRSKIHKYCQLPLNRLPTM